MTQSTPSGLTQLTQTGLTPPKCVSLAQGDLWFFLCLQQPGSLHLMAAELKLNKAEEIRRVRPGQIPTRTSAGKKSKLQFLHRISVIPAMSVQ
jgi:hypothetical protein